MQALEAELRVSECDVYSYQPTDSDRDPFSEHHTLYASSHSPLLAPSLTAHAQVVL